MAGMSVARAIRLAWRWERYIRRCNKLRAYPVASSWERDYDQEVVRNYRGSYRRVRY